MHNIKKGSISASKAEALRQKGAQYLSLSQEVLRMRAAGQHDERALELTAKALRANVEHYTAWNFRKDVLRHVHGEEPDAAAVEQACKGELELTQAALGDNPKAYCVWHHRLWALTWGKCAWALPRELKLCDKLLALDARNFHCWQYRRTIAERLERSPEDELAFVTDQISRDFSNYSAWHYRSKVLEARGEVDAQVLKEEFELVRNAFYTAPDDSSAWFYHRWLLEKAATHSAVPEVRSLLAEELRVADELIDLEPGSKWPKVAAARLCILLGGGAGASRGVTLLDELEAVDPMRRAHYGALRAKLGPAG